MNRVLALSFGALLSSGTLAAQAVPATMRADWERDRANVLAYIDAMPESALTYRPTPGVRTFAQQIDHIVGTNVDVAATTLRGLPHSPQLGDSTQFLHSKSALHAYAAATYDYVLQSIQLAGAATWRRPSSMYGQPPELPERWLQLSHEHSVWTLGQVVPYLRLNRVTPPAYQMPF